MKLFSSGISGGLQRFFAFSIESEHPPALVSTGQAYVTGLINAVMQRPELREISPA